MPLVQRTPAHQEPVIPFDDGGKDADGHEAMPTPVSGSRLADSGFGKRNVNGN